MWPSMTWVPTEPGPDCESSFALGELKCSQPSWENCLPILNDLLNTPSSNVTYSVNRPGSPQADAIIPPLGSPGTSAALLP
jgi:hypothetical protein